MNGRFLCEEIVKSGGLPLNPPVKKKRFEARTDKGNLTVWLWKSIMTVFPAAFMRLTRTWGGI